MKPGGATPLFGTKNKLSVARGGFITTLEFSKCYGGGGYIMSISLNLITVSQINSATLRTYTDSTDAIMKLVITLVSGILTF